MGYFTSAVNWLTYYGPLSGLWAFVSLYTNFTDALRKRFKAINDKLEEFKVPKRMCRSKIEFLSGNIIQVKLHYL